MANKDPTRRDFVTGMAGGSLLSAGFAGAAPAASPSAPSTPADAALPNGADDRRYMLGILERMATPVLGPMSRGRLQREWSPELSPTWDGRDARVAYMECFGRLIDGLAPWLALPAEQTAEGKLRRTLRDQARAACVHCVDPKSPDYLLWSAEGQPLVDSAFFTSALLRAPDALWAPLDAATKRRIIEHIQGLRRVSPPYTNWLLFAAMNEAFLLSVGAQWDPLRVELAVRKFGEWYVGDGWYADGERFHFDYYNSFVIHPMLALILETLAAKSVAFQSRLPVVELLALQIRRMQRHAEQMERLVGFSGEIAPIGRSLTYRTAAHQVLGVLAWRKQLPASLPEGQVRAATVAAQRRMFADATNFDARGFLTLGFSRHQPSLANVYSNAGSMYIASESLLALGRAADDTYWTCEPAPWTSRLAYSGGEFPPDNYVAY
jgi:hypothetical protein